MKQLVNIDLQKYLDKSFAIRKKLYDLQNSLNLFTEEDRNLFNIMFRELDINDEPGVEEAVIFAHLVALAKRVIELNDKPLLDTLVALNIVEEIDDEEDDVEYKDKGKGKGKDKDE